MRTSVKHLPPLEPRGHPTRHATLGNTEMPHTEPRGCPPRTCHTGADRDALHEPRGRPTRTCRTGKHRDAPHGVPVPCACADPNSLHTAAPSVLSRHLSNESSSWLCHQNTHGAASILMVCPQLSWVLLVASHICCPAQHAVKCGSGMNTQWKARKTVNCDFQSLCGYTFPPPSSAWSVLASLCLPLSSA